MLGLRYLWQGRVSHMVHTGYLQLMQGCGNYASRPWHAYCTAQPYLLTCNSPADPNMAVGWLQTLRHR